jgi:gamma-aminobutyric acid type B receptor
VFLYALGTSLYTVQVVKECELYVVLGVLLILDVVIMTAWQLVEPFERVLENFPPELTNTDIELLPQLEHCSSPTLYIWLGP